jgi:hypothetical protein
LSQAWIAHGTASPVIACRYAAGSGSQRHRP